MALQDSTPPSSWGKHLASTDKKTRDKAVKSLAVFLSDPSHEVLSAPEMAKLWKGIFYCYWMSDKPLVQQALSSELAELVLAITSTPAALVFLRGFWEAMVREWSNIDRLRMDKYYMLIRKFINASFRLLMRTGWSEEYCQENNDMLTRTGAPLCADDNRVPSSLAYHLCDIYLEELDKVLATASDSAPPTPLSTLVSPFMNLAALTKSMVTYQRVYSTVLEPLFTSLGDQHVEIGTKRKLPESSFSNICANSCLSHPKEETKLQPRELRKALLKEMFDIASLPDTREANRRRLYAVWKEAMAEEEDELNEG